MPSGWRLVGDHGAHLDLCPTRAPHRSEAGCTLTPSPHCCPRRRSQRPPLPTHTHTHTHTHTRPPAPRAPTQSARVEGMDAHAVAANTKAMRKNRRLDISECDGPIASPFDTAKVTLRRAALCQAACRAKLRAVCVWGGGGGGGAWGEPWLRPKFCWHCCPTIFPGAVQKAPLGARWLPPPPLLSTQSPHPSPIRLPHQRHYCAPRPSF